ncbi:MAG: penicillin-binding protein 1C [Gammaproteobacteria bacterium]|nr:penicillin-binding protein 1C [Gammaproteobacteria bacterium]MYF28794.1 penicillin-binding protein 1C [Gammaproteobacteria bacterium]MYK46625.1 penicillin-binding protein 1C [Gammaproteobacteria bacterium]
MAILSGIAACASLVWVVLPKPALYGDIDFSTLVTDREGRPLKLVAAKDGRYRLFTRLDDIAPAAREATLLYEDRGFYRHYGVNPLALARAAWTTYVRRSRVVGGSTITMQLARLRFGLDTRTVFGKLVQSVRAVQLERHYGKDEILEAYLNLAPYGGSIEGIGTASRVYFDKPSSALGLGEALALAVIPQNPTDRFPVTAQGRAELLAARDRLFAAWESNTDDAQIETSARARLVPTFASPSRLPSHAPHFVRDHVPMTGVSHVRTTLDLEVQRLVEARVADHVELRRRDGIANAAAMLIEARRMEVLALVGSAGFFDEAIAGQVNGVRARRSPGSTLKPLLYALALDDGLIHPMTLLEDAPRRYAAYTPENFDRGFTGPVFARDALIHSRNVPAVALLADLGVERFRDWLHSAGVTGLRSAADYGLALALGGSEITMEELVRLYATLAAGGLWRDLVVVPGSVSAAPQRLLSPEASFLVLDMLRDVARPGKTARDPDRGVIAWKTGTSFGFRDAWSVGVVGPYVLAVWVGNFDGSANPALVGREAAAPLFFAIADSLVGNKRQGEPATIRVGGLNVKRVEVCATTGDLPGPHCPRTTRSWFIPGVSPIKVSSVYRAIDIDRLTGLRSCGGDADTDRVVYEFWPSNLQAVFRRAGIAIRRPPPWSPACSLDETSATGFAPRIRSPQRTLVYHAAAPGPAEGTVLFSAVVDGDVQRMFWFVDHRLVATTVPGENYFWTPRTGRFTVRVVDDLGRADSEPIRVDGFPGQ